jgi:hypothetical protein
MSRQDALKSKEVFCARAGNYLKRASVPSVSKKLSHNGLGVRESVPESVLASVPDSGARNHEATAPRDYRTTGRRDLVMTGLGQPAGWGP